MIKTYKKNKSITKYDNNVRIESNLHLLVRLELKLERMPVHSCQLILIKLA